MTFMFENNKLQTCDKITGLKSINLHSTSHPNM